MKFRSLLLLVFVLATASAHAGVNISFQINGDNLTTDSTLLVGIPDGTAIMIAAATNGTTFAPLTPGTYASDTVWGTGPDTDVVIWETSANGTFQYGVPGSITNTTISLNLASFTGWAGGDPLAIYWFPGTSIVSNSITLSGGEIFGTFNNSSAGTIPNPASWVTPSSTSSGYVLAFLNAEASGNIGTGNDVGTFGHVTSVPEPSTFALLGGVLALGAVLRRRIAAVV